MHLAKFPRVRFSHAPTPLEPLDRLTKHLDGPRLFIKRDDCTGLATGGNKTRKLEFLIADALAKGADTIITQGAVQSNHARQTAAAAVRHGLKCMILLENRTGNEAPEYCESGNVFLDHLIGAPTRIFPAGTPMNDAMQTAAAQCRDHGGKPYIIPGGGSNAIGALGYVECALELLVQANAQGIRLDRVVHATGSAGTQAGLIAGFEGSRSGVAVLGIGVRAPKVEQEESVRRLAVETTELMGMHDVIDPQRVVANCDYVGKGYGIPTQAMISAVTLLARTEGILLDPVYSGKAMAGLIDLIHKEHFTKDQNIVFLHTGGSVGLFGYRDAFMAQRPAWPFDA
jgi:L-cysteate sulfo-lyase